jgi:hypothetical protein
MAAGRTEWSVMASDYLAQPSDGPRANSPSDLDVAIEAIVYDEHPALARRPVDYPYGPRQPERLPEPNSAPLSLLLPMAGGLQSFIDTINRRPDYVVPRRFGMSAILGIMTALAGIFGALHWLNAEPVYYAFFAIQSLVICLAQMLHGQTPRQASILAGAIILPLFMLIAANFAEPHVSGGAYCLIVPAIPAGALLGYLTGTCAAGIFLVMDRLEGYFKGQAEIAPPLTMPRPAP